jgi:protein-S-isoprenylcysteine O-methyltransferase Ste14
MDSVDRRRQQRGNFLTLFLALFFCAGVLAVSFALCGGLALAMVAVGLCVAAAGSAHYLLWGRTFDRAVEGERREQEFRDLLDADDSPARNDGPDGWR